MPNQSQKSEEQAERKQKPELQPLQSPTTGIEQVTGAELGPNPELTADQANIQAQANQLSNPHVQLLQRQMIAGQISHTYGNMHMQRVMTAMKGNHTGAANNNTTVMRQPTSETEAENLEPENSQEVDVPSGMTAANTPPPDVRKPDSPIQTKLTVNEPGDMYEQEADQMAEAVMRLPASAPPPPPNEEKEPAADLQQSISRAPATDDNSATTASPGVESHIQEMQGGGSALPDAERSFFEDRMGADLSNVRVHTDDAAAQTSQDLNARAFTVGSDIAFNAGEYQPGSNNGRQLLAHELTHVIQQGGADGLQRKPQTDATIQRKMTTQIEISQPEPVEAPAEGEGQVSEGEATSTPETLPAANGDQPAGGPEAEEEAVIAPPKVVAEEEDEPAATDTIKTASTGGPETAEQIAEFSPVEVDPMAKVNATSETINPADAGGQLKAETDGVQTENQAVLEEAVEKTAAVKEEVKAQSEEALGQAQASTDQLNEARSGLETLTGAMVSFAPIEEEEGNPSEAEVIEMLLTGELQHEDLVTVAEQPDPEIQAQIAAEMVSNFISSSAQGITEFTALGETVGPRLQPIAEQAKAQISAAAAENQALVANALAELRSQATGEAEAAKGEISGQYEATVTAIKSATENARTQLQAEYTAKLTELTGLKDSETTAMTGVFNTAEQNILSAGQATATEAKGLGEAAAANYAQEPLPPEKPSFFEGSDFYIRKRQAKVDAALQVGESYRSETEKKTNETAGSIKNGLPELIAEIDKGIASATTALDTEYNNALTELGTLEQQALEAAEKFKQSQFEAVEQGLTGTLESITQLEASLPQQIMEMAEQQAAGVDRDVNQLIASIQEGVAQSAATLQAALQDMQGQLSGVQPPDPDSLQSILAEAQAQAEAMRAQMEADLETQIAQGEEHLTLLGEQGTQALAAQGESAVAQQITPLGQGFSTSMSELTAMAAESFAQQQTGHTEGVTAKVEQTGQRFQQVYDQTQTQLQNLRTTVEGKLTEQVNAFTTEIKTPVQTKEPDDIKKAAEDAAAKVQPAWKKVLATVLTIIVTVLVTIAIAALVASGVGLLAGLALAALIGAVGGILKGMIQNWSEGKPLVTSWQELAINGVVGAIEGMLEFAGGRFVKGLGLADGFKKMVIERAVDTVTGTISDTISRVATLAQNGQLTWESGFNALLNSAVNNVISNAVSLGGGALTDKIAGKVTNKVAKTVTQEGLEYATDVVGGVLSDEELRNKILSGKATWDDFTNTVGQQLFEVAVEKAAEGGLTKKKFGGDDGKEGDATDSGDSGKTVQDSLTDFFNRFAKNGDGSGNVDTDSRPVRDEATSTDDTDTATTPTETPTAQTPDQTIADPDKVKPVDETTPVDQTKDETVIPVTETTPDKTKDVTDSDADKPKQVDETTPVKDEVVTPPDKTKDVTDSDADKPKQVDETTPVKDEVVTPPDKTKDVTDGDPDKTKSTETTPPDKTPKADKLSTGAKKGDDPDAESIRQGTVRMEDHPDYQKLISQAEQAGFKVIPTNGDPHVEVIHVYDVDGNLIRIDRELHVQPEMRYLDLEHELGHIDQLSRFGDDVPPTKKVTEYPDGRVTDAKNQQGILKTDQATIVEYHNRLVEFLRLFDRGVDPKILREHADGLREWQKKYWDKGLSGGRSESKKKWADEYFGDIGELNQRFRDAMETLNKSATDDTSSDKPLTTESDKDDDTPGGLYKSGDDTKDGETNQSAVQKLMEELPTVVASPQNKEDLQSFVANTLGLEPDNIKLKLISGEGAKGVSGAPVYLVTTTADGNLIAVTKVFPKTDEFARELSALERLSEGDLTKLHSVDVLGTGKAESGEGILIMSAASGKSLDDYMDNVKKASTPEERVEAMNKLNQAIAETAAALAELHTQPEGSGGPVAEEYMQFYTNQVDDITKKIIQHPEVLSQAGITAEEFTAKIQDIINSFKENPGGSSLAHGDAHPGNFFFDQESGVTAIDTPTLLFSMDSEGKPIGAAGRDIANFDQKLAFFGLQFGLTDAEVQRLRDTFKNSYAESCTQTGAEVPMTPEAKTFFATRTAIGELIRSISNNEDSGVIAKKLQLTLQALGY